MKFLKKLLTYVFLFTFNVVLLFSTPSFAENKLGQERAIPIALAPAAIAAAEATIGVSIGTAIGVAINKDTPKGGHESNIRPSSKPKHEKGDARRKQDQGGDKKRNHGSWKSNNNKNK